MTLPVYPSSLSFTQIQTEHGGSNPISLAEYYRSYGYTGASTAGYPPPPAPPLAAPSATATYVPTGPAKTPPAANLVDPRSGWTANPISVGNFLGSKFNSMSDTNTGYYPSYYTAITYGVTAFGHGIGSWNTWVFDTSDATTTFTTPAYPTTPAGKTWNLKFYCGTGNFYVYVGSWHYWEQQGYYTANWYRYDKFSGAAAMVYKGSTVLANSSAGAGTNTIQYNGDWQYVSTPAISGITLEPSTTYTLKVGGYSLRDDGNGTDSKAQMGSYSSGYPYYYVVLTGS